MAANLRGDLLGAKVHLNGDFALWAGILAGPIAWSADLTIGYALANTRCNHQQTFLALYLLTGAALALIALGVLASITAPRVNERAQFMSRLGLASSALFAVLVIAMGIPRFTLHVCY